MNSSRPQWSADASRRMTDAIHAEVKNMVANSRLQRKSEGIALVDRQDLHVGNMLGKGAFSEVHEVKIIPAPGEEEDHQIYAMKHLKSRLMSQPDNFRLAAAELAVEAHMLASFDHPNVMKIRGWAANGVASFTEGRHDSFFLLLDRLDETLDQRINTWRKQADFHQATLPRTNSSNVVSDLWRRFNPEKLTEEQMLAQRRLQHDMSKMHLEKIGVCVEIASGLAYLHEQGVIFRDLKPNNIGFLNGRVQLFDFGLSRELPSLNLQEPFEMSGKVGTLRYMAVEVACHQVYNVSADVYSWAMVCYEIFTHEKPFAGWTREMHASLVCGRGMRPEVQSLPNSIRPLLEACWSQHAHHRPTMQVAEQSMKQLEEKEILSVNQDRQPVVELPHGFSVGVRKNTNRNYSEAEFTRSTVSVSVSSESLSNSVYLY